jgi:hypothetical protein
MDITYLGQNGFRIKGKSRTVILDGDNKSEVVIKSEEADKIFKIDGPGEYETGGVSVIGIAHESKTIFVIEMENLRIAHFMKLEQKLSQEQVEEIGEIDILIMDLTLGMELAKQIDPWVVIPVSENGDKMIDFLKQMGKPDLPAIPKYSVTFERLPEEMQVIVLEKK